MRAGRYRATCEPAAVRTFDAQEALDVRFYEVRARSVLNKVPKASRMPCGRSTDRWKSRLYVLLARSTHPYLDFDAGRDFEREIVVKVNTPELARGELMRPRWTREHVALGTNTDPYQWVEKRYRCRASGRRCATREHLLGAHEVAAAPARRQALQADRASADLSVPTLDEKAWRAGEPHTPPPRKRLEAVALSRAGIPCGVLIAPLMPGINDAPEPGREILRLCGRRAP